VPNTVYYFKVKVTDKFGHSTLSDLFTFRAANGTIPPKIAPGTLVAYSGNNILSFLNPSQGEQNPAIVLPINTDYKFSFSLSGNKSIERIKGILKEANVLAASTTTNTNDHTPSIEFQEVNPGTYLGRFLGQNLTGIYDLYIQIFDSGGNIIEQKLVRIKIVTPFTVLSTANQKPIEDAIILFYLYNPTSKIYGIIPSDLLGTKNPASSIYNGTVPIVFASGKYRASINALGYKQKTVDFTIDPNTQDNYPMILLEPEPFNIITFIIYYAGIIYDVFLQTAAYIHTLSLSIRFFDLVSAVALILFVTTVIFSFSVRTHIKLQYIPEFFLFNLEDLLRIKKNRYIHGRILDQTTGKPVTQARISIFDAKTGQLLKESISNKLGEFYMLRPKAQKYKVAVQKANFHEISVDDYLPNAITEYQEYFIQRKDEEIKPSFVGLALGGFENLIGFGFELLLLSSILFELIFTQTQGLYKTLPYIVVTILTIIVWLFYAKRILRKTSSPGF
jgi:hypothetical protein